MKAGRQALSPAAAGLVGLGLASPRTIPSTIIGNASPSERLAEAAIGSMKAGRQVLSLAAAGLSPLGLASARTAPSAIVGIASPAGWAPVAAIGSSESRRAVLSLVDAGLATLGLGSARTVPPTIAGTAVAENGSPTVGIRPFEPVRRTPALLAATPVALPVGPAAMEVESAGGLACFMDFASACAVAGRELAPRSKRLPSAAPARPFRAALGTVEADPIELHAPAAMGALDLTAAALAGALYPATSGAPRPIGAARPLAISCMQWPGAETPIGFRHTQAGEGGLFIPQIRTNTLRPAILILPGPPGSTPVDEAAHSGRTSVISIADLRGGSAPIKERATLGARRR
ncbi:MAG: hypothetical protein JSU00_01020 [Acidobacteria bacterium]|nr:hypothetical protein [Acidobacteriota bacterium]